MLSSTGKKEKLTASKGSEIEVCSNEYDRSTGYIWYRAILEENLAVSKRKKLAVRHLDPQTNEDYSPPLITTAVHRLIRPLPPLDPSPEVDFEEGDMVDAAHRGGWWSGWVVKVLLPSQRFLVYLRFEPDVIEVERKDLRPHMVWKDEEWFRCEKRHLMESDFSAGTSLEVRIKGEDFGNIWVSAIAITENEDGTLLVKYKSLSGEKEEGEEDGWTKTSVPYSEIRPPPPTFDLRAFALMENVDALLESGGWCPSIVSKVLCGERYTLLLGPNKESKDFDLSQLRPSMEWKDGAWLSKEKVSDIEESLHAAEEATGSTRKREKLRTTRSSTCTKNLPPPKESVTENETQLPQTPVQLSGDLGSKMANGVVNGNTPVARQPEIAEKKEFHSSVVLAVAAIQLTKQAVKTQGKTTPRKKLQAMKNQKGFSGDESVGVKAPEESSNRESVNKRKRGRQPRKFVSAEANQKQETGVDVNGTADMTDDDDQPLASWIHGGNSSSGQSAPPPVVPDPMLSSVVEKHVVETPKAKDSTIVLPFAKKSPCWKVLESMEIFKAVPQRPHFSPLLQCEEESREGDAIGAMVNFTGLLEKLRNIQVDSSVSAINRIKESFLKLEKHGFDITAPLSRIDKLLSIKESQTWALEELQAAEREITENDNKRRKCEEDIEQVSKKIVALQKQEALLKEAKVTMEKEKARMQTHAAVLDQKVQIVEQEFQATVTLPW
ncbi:unnamed protein product [Eruca vesicaria subsp. sativa]|uniref:Agenet domain-containing protein n=1 Tax=Eruca vesicaria subsp. sativa TaxID=29727 RepID=A0ABC8KH54_ERUVS|nr:unnamed protein product [Eruca vesicaria subsp. sativa]